MSEQGRTLHLRLSATKSETALRKLDAPCAILGSNRNWTTFVPLGDAELDLSELARRCSAGVLQVWFDEDSSIVFRAATSDGWQAEASFPLDRSYEFGIEDEKWFEAMVQRKLVSSRVVQSVVKKLRTRAGPRESWIRSHGLEQTLGLPFITPMPVPSDERLTRELAPAAMIVKPTRTTGTKPAAMPSQPAPGPMRSWSPAERRIVDLHVHYLTALWSMNDWKVYNRYKKHLPAERRREVDAFVDQMMRGASDEALRQRLEDILGTIWEAEDWLAVIRDPRIVQNEPLDAKDVADWQRRLADAERA